MIDRLDRAGLLPAITFIFSRVGCDAAVEQCMYSGLRLTTMEEAEQIRAHVEERTADIPQEDLDVLGYRDWLAGLERGLAAHHAGMLPTFKEIVEELFTEGLIKAVFATETLALGINMPARTVVIERLVKWNGEMHADLTPGEYTQLTGRAGRRGIDVEGHAVVLWTPGVDPGSVAGLAGTRTYPLNSSFRPSYNMAVNLVGQVGRERARTLLEESFAQFQADRAVVGLARQLRRSEEALEGYLEAATCHLGDFKEYAGLRRRLSDREKELARVRSGAQRAEAARSLERLRPGDVIVVPNGRWAGVALVLEPGGGQARRRPLTARAHRQPAGQAARPDGLPRAGRAGRARTDPLRRSAASPPSTAVTWPRRCATRPRGSRSPRPVKRREPAGEDPEITELRRRLREHPCHGCAEREDHSRWAERYFRLERETADLRRRVEGRSQVISRTFDRVCAVLEQLGYLEDERVTDAGPPPRPALQRVRPAHRRVPARGHLERPGPRRARGERVGAGLRVPAGRRQGTADPRRARYARRWRRWSRLSEDLREVERDHRVAFLREPDLGFVWAAYRWATGHQLDAVLSEADLTAGDFVRWTKQLLDLLGQVAEAAPRGSGIRDTAGTRHGRHAPRRRGLLVGDLRPGAPVRGRRAQASRPGRGQSSSSASATSRSASGFVMRIRMRWVMTTPSLRHTVRARATVSRARPIMVASSCWVSGNGSATAVVRAGHAIALGEVEQQQRQQLGAAGAHLGGHPPVGVVHPADHHPREDLCGVGVGVEEVGELLGRNRQGAHPVEGLHVGRTWTAVQPSALTDRVGRTTDRQHHLVAVRATGRHLHPSVQDDQDMVGIGALTAQQRAGRVLTDPPGRAQRGPLGVVQCLPKTVSVRERLLHRVPVCPSRQRFAIEPHFLQWT